MEEVDDTLEPDNNWFSQTPRTQDEIDFDDWNTKRIRKQLERNQ